MSNVRALSILRHPRVAWSYPLDVTVFTKLSWLRGTGTSFPQDKEKRAKWYHRAKERGDLNAAAQLVRAALALNQRALDSLIDGLLPHVEAGREVIFAVPHPPFADEKCDGADLVGSRRVKNALPIQFAVHLSEIVGGRFAYEIVQAARVGRTSMSRLQRYLWQPSFSGDVDSIGVYVIADDVFTMGGTLAALHSYIVSHGGTVVAVAALAHNTGTSQPLALRPDTWQQLQSVFGPSLATFWAQEIGHDAHCLSEPEGRGLLDWAHAQHGLRGESLLHRLRACLVEAAAEGNQ